VKYRGNLIEQDHRAHQTVDEAWNGLFLVRDSVANRYRGFEVMNMLRKGQMQGVAKEDVKGQVLLIATLFGVVA